MLYWLLPSAYVSCREQTEYKCDFDNNFVIYTGYYYDVGFLKTQTQKRYTKKKKLIKPGHTSRPRSL